MHKDWTLPATATCHSLQDYAQFAGGRTAAELVGTESQIARSFSHSIDHDAKFHVPGRCAVCRRDVAFLMDGKYRDSSGPNWRERMVCPICKLNNRMRLSLHFVEQFGRIEQSSEIYITEQTTPFHAVLRTRYRSVTGSEYLRDGTMSGATNQAGLRHEDMTALSFRDEAFDLICTFDVLEHVPEYEQGVRECARCLKPEGRLLVSVPFDLNGETTEIRARVRSDGSIEHILPPIYHGDPLDPRGVLCYQTFGWDFLNLLARAGFAEPTLFLFWSPGFGYLGGPQPLIFAAKT